ncbi:MAG: SDR family NAD(P)-dependent oxidoreductase [Candidatus Omnitrophica bacterium]|nr:SDR family NAD(P)-dependent oxidoreductase [Candidatus Omnitrophota bacterium]
MTKRLVDIFAAILSLFFLFPLFLFIALIIKLDSKGPVFFKQKRVGLKGKIFSILKFRTMTLGEGLPITREGDSRITAFGRFLRNIKLDEIPQFINVLFGDLSLIGPRPEVPQIVAYYNANQLKILDYKPGLISPATLEFIREEEFLKGDNYLDIYLSKVMPKKIESDYKYFKKDKDFFSDLKLIGRVLRQLIGSVRSVKRLIFAKIYGLLNKALTLIKYLIDVFLTVICLWLAYYIRFEGIVPSGQILLFQRTMFIFVPGFLISHYLFGLTKGIWRYISIKDVQKIVLSILTGNGVSMLLGFLILHTTMINIPRSVYIINGFLLFFSITGVRVLYRIIYDKFGRPRRKNENVLIVGDKDIAVSLLYSVRQDFNHSFNVVGFISQQAERIGSTINAIPILGLVSHIQRLVNEKNVKYIFIAIGQASNDEMKKIIKISQKTNAQVRIVPTMLDVVDGKFSLRDLREIRFEDYLDRSPVEFNLQQAWQKFNCKTVLITGGGGSIGSSICREIVKLRPAKLIVFDVSEDNLFKISQQLKDPRRKDKMDDVECLYKLGDIREEKAVERIFEDHKIDYVIHSAARKHVPLSEINIIEAISTNVFGTLNMAKISAKYAVKKFIYISTDKAVEPTSVMGATKRVGEFIIRCLGDNKEISTKYIGVRFGNVIGSSGNVVETFSYQLQRGTAVTITDPDMQRYFMSLGEATKLILQAASLDDNSGLFVLDMGQPVKIKDLAYDMALFYGRHLKEEDIVYIGKRAGEKMTEKLWGTRETEIKLPFTKIFKVEENCLFSDVLEKVEGLRKLLSEYDENRAKDALFSIVK